MMKSLKFSNKLLLVLGLLSGPFNVMIAADEPENAQQVLQQLKTLREKL